MDDILKDIPGYEDYYAITEDGKVYSYPRWVYPQGRREYLKTGRFRKSVCSKDGYLGIDLWVENEVRRYYIHQLVAMTYIRFPNSKNEVVHHKDFNILNNHYTNLEYITKSQQSIEMWKNPNNDIEAMKDAILRNNAIAAKKKREKLNCKKCGTSYILKSDGKRGCPKCIRELQKEWIKNNPDRVKEISKKNYPKYEEQRKLYRENNKDKAKEYYLINKDKILERNRENSKEWYQKNKDKISEKRKERYKLKGT